METRIIELDSPREYLDGSVVRYLVQLLHDDGSIANTGRGFEFLRDAQLYEDGILMALRTAQPAPCGGSGVFLNSLSMWGRVTR